MLVDMELAMLKYKLVNIWWRIISTKYTIYFLCLYGTKLSQDMDLGVIGNET